MDFLRVWTRCHCLNAKPSSPEAIAPQMSKFILGDESYRNFCSVHATVKAVAGGRPPNRFITHNHVDAASSSKVEYDYDLSNTDAVLLCLSFQKSQIELLLGSSHREGEDANQRQKGREGDRKRDRTNIHKMVWALFTVKEQVSEFLKLEEVEMQCLSNLSRCDMEGHTSRVLPSFS